MKNKYIELYENYVEQLLEEEFLLDIKNLADTIINHLEKEQLTT